MENDWSAVIFVCMGKRLKKYETFSVYEHLTPAICCPYLDLCEKDSM